MEISNYSTNGNLSHISVLLGMANNSNGTEPLDGIPSGPLVTLLVPIIMFATGVFGNLVALLVLWRSRKENSRSVFYRLVAGLAVTDLFGIVATSPVTILVYSNDRQWLGGQPLCDYFSFMMIFAGLATVLIVGAMALERLLAILHPYLYERHVFPHRVKYCMMGIWLVATFISCLPLMGLGTNQQQYPGTWCFFDYYSDRTADRVFSFFYASVGLGVIAGTAICNTAVMCVLLRMRRVSKNMGKSHEGRTLNMTREMQMIFFLAGIVFVFAACYAPLMVRVIINASRSFPENVGADLLAIRLASVNQILDPWVYLLFRRRLAALLYSACKTVSPLQNMSSFRTLRGSEYFQDSQRGTPSPKLRGSGKAKNGYVAESEASPKREITGNVASPSFPAGTDRPLPSSNGRSASAGNGRVTIVENGRAAAVGERDAALENESVPTAENGRAVNAGGRDETVETGEAVTVGNERDTTVENGVAVHAVSGTKGTSGNEEEVSVQNETDGSCGGGRHMTDKKEANSTNGRDVTVADDSDVSVAKERDITVPLERDITMTNRRDTTVAHKMDIIVTNERGITAAFENGANLTHESDVTATKERDTAATHGMGVTVNSVVCQHGKQGAVKAENFGAERKTPVDAESELIPLLTKTNSRNQTAQCSQCNRDSKNVAVV